MPTTSCRADNPRIRAHPCDSSDQHSGRCRASFTCIDCSKTFRNSGEWKSHTTCISEDEKYQGALFKGKNKKVSPLALPWACG